MEAVCIIVCYIAWNMASKDREQVGTSVSWDEND